MHLQFATAFHSAVDRSAGEDKCWPWMKARTSGGYGHFGYRGRMYYAHRVAYELARGPLPRGVGVLHRCDFPACCNPSHLFVGSQADNAQDREAKGRGSRHIVRYGQTNPAHRLTPEQVCAIRAAARAGTSKAALGRTYGVNASTISRIVAGLVWAQVRDEEEAS